MKLSLDDQNDTNSFSQVAEDQALFNPVVKKFSWWVIIGMLSIFGFALVIVKPMLLIVTGFVVLTITAYKRMVADHTNSSSSH